MTTWNSSRGTSIGTPSRRAARETYATNLAHGQSLEEADR